MRNAEETTERVWNFNSCQLTYDTMLNLDALCISKDSNEVTNYISQNSNGHTHEFLNKNKLLKLCKKNNHFFTSNLKRGDLQKMLGVEDEIPKDSDPNRKDVLDEIMAKMEIKNNENEMRLNKINELGKISLMPPYSDITTVVYEY